MSWQFFQKTKKLLNPTQLREGFAIFWPQIIVIFLAREELPTSILTLVGVLWALTLVQWIWKPLKFNQRVFNIFSIFVPVLIYFQFKTFLGRDAAAAFLMLLSALKAFEYRPSTDRYFSVYLNMASLGIGFLFELELWTSLLGLVALLFCLFNLLSPGLKQRSLRKQWGYVLGSFLFAVPLTVFLFFFFPRLGFTLNITGGEARQSKAWTGFSEEIKPGSLREIIQTDEIIFRGHFASYYSDDDLYWRGLVLEDPNGLAWSRVPKSFLPEPKKNIENADYSIRLNPQPHRWLFVLDGTNEIESSTPLLRSREAFQQTSISSQVISYEGKISELPEKTTVDEERRNKVIYPTFLRGTVKAWIESLPANLKTRDKVRYLESYIRKEGFQYSMSSNNLMVNSLADFLFNTKIGYCEHYASVFSHVLRYWGVPSRVVVGFVGGERNELGDYITVRGRHAHAWIEYANEDHEWVRWDPTRSLRPSVGLAGIGSTSEVFAILSQQVEAFADYLNYQWSQLIVQFDRAEQLRRFSDLKFPPIYYFAFTVLALVSMILLLYLLVFRVNERREDPLLLYRDLIYFLQRKDWIQSLSLTPQELKVNLTAKFPNSSHQINHAMDVYSEAYKEKGLSDTKALVKSFKNLRRSLKSS